MKFINSALYDLILLSTRRYFLLEKFDLEESDFIDEYNNFYNALNSEQQKVLTSIKDKIVEFCANTSDNNCIKTLHYGVKVGMELKETFLEIDNEI